MNWFRKLRIRTKLLIGFIFLTCLLIFIGIYSIIQINGLANSGIQVFHDFTNPLGEVAFMTRDYYKLRIGFRDLRNSHTLEEIAECEATFQKNTESLEKHNEIYKEAITNEKGKELYDSYYDMLAMWKDSVFHCFELRKDDREKEFQELFARTIFVGNIIAEEKLETLVDYKILRASKIKDANYVSANFSKTFMMVIIIICTIISMVLIFSIISNFATVIRKIMTEIEHLDGESEGLSVVSDVAANASVKLQSQTQTAASSSEQISANVSTVASSVEELSASISEISKNTTSATALTKKSEERANEASGVMNELGQSSLEIGNIVKSITGIAEQTNLLALNATIEAARAGEFGKGFAVVANEVKELAKESAKATEDITRKIKVVQDNTKNAIDVIQEIIQNAVKINEVTTSIASAVEEQAITTHEVNKNIGEAKVGVGSIVEVITGITRATIEYVQQSDKVKNSSSALKALASELDRQIKASF